MSAKITEFNLILIPPWVQSLFIYVRLQYLQPLVFLINYFYLDQDLIDKRQTDTSFYYLFLGQPPY
jgi:hypothetical protein